MKFKLRQGDNLELLKKLPDNSIDAVVSDPPYGLSFMGKKWDYDVPSVEFWKEVYRVLKPGGHVLSFGGTRTYHRMVVNIEDAGFEIRDQIMWLYGSGFPKSHNIGKAVDKIQGNEREVVGEKEQTGAKFKSWSDDPEQTRWHNQGFNKLDGKTFGITKGQSKYEGWGTALNQQMNLSVLLVSH
jgi:DNA modification methylase